MLCIYDRRLTECQTGHSLGGSLASLIGLTFGAPVVAFEAPGEKLAASRLHLPLPLSLDHITHIYHTADPIAMGTCNGVSSSCALGGYAMETHCHLGKVIKYDTVSKLKWGVDVRTHGIAVVVDQLLSKDWPEDDEDGGEKAGEGKGKGNVPTPAEEADCVVSVLSSVYAVQVRVLTSATIQDCFNWEFGEYKNVSLASRGGCGSF